MGVAAPDSLSAIGERWIDCAGKRIEKRIELYASLGG